MRTWNEIISQPGTGEERLEDFLELWADIMSVYDSVPIMSFTTITIVRYLIVNTSAVIFR